MRAKSRETREMELVIARLLFEDLLEQQRHMSSLRSPVPSGRHSSIPVGDPSDADSSVDQPAVSDADDPAGPTITVSTFLGCPDVQAMVARGDLDLHSLAIVLMEVGIALPRHSSLMENNILSFAVSSSDGIHMNFAQFAEAFRLVNQLSIAANVDPDPARSGDDRASLSGDLPFVVTPMSPRTYSGINWDEMMDADVDVDVDGAERDWDDGDPADGGRQPTDSHLDSIERWLRANDADGNR